jgi:hypothetical protein
MRLGVQQEPIEEVSAMAQLQVLEDNGLAAFDAGWQELGDQLVAQLKGPTWEESRA